MMLDEVVSRHDEDKADEIPEVLDYYSQGEYGENFVKQFEDLEPNDDLSLQMNLLLYHSISEKFVKVDKSIFSDLKEQYEQYAQAKGFSKEQTDSALEYHAYISGKIDKNWSKFIEQWEYVLENYLVNFIFSEIFPLRYLSKDLNPYHHAFILAEQYAFLRMLFCGNFDGKEGFTKKYITHTIFQLALINQHSQEPFITTENYRLIGIDSPAHLYYLLI
jgi:lysine-N-methylase